MGQQHTRLSHLWKEKEIVNLAIYNAMVRTVMKVQRPIMYNLISQTHYLSNAYWLIFSKQSLLNFNIITQAYSISINNLC